MCLNCDVCQLIGNESVTNVCYVCQLIGNESVTNVCYVCQLIGNESVTNVYYVCQLRGNESMCNNNNEDFYSTLSLASAGAQRTYEKILRVYNMGKN